MKGNLISMHKLMVQTYQYFEEVNQGLIKKIGSNLRILDVGCGYGILGEAMAKGNNVVFGVDISESAIEKAKTRLHFAAVCDITKKETYPLEIKERKFDLIVLADILEHVYDPRSILYSVKDFLKTDGKLILSVPNVANWSNRLQLLFGFWNYTVSGVLDRTHIRFFTRKSIKLLLKSAGYEILEISATPYLTRAFAVPFRNLIFPDSRDKSPSKPEALMESGYYKFYLKYIYPIESFITRCYKNLLAFQFIIIAKPKTEPSH